MRSLSIKKCKASLKVHPVFNIKVPLCVQTALVARTRRRWVHRLVGYEMSRERKTMLPCVIIGNTSPALVLHDVTARINSSMGFFPSPYDATVLRVDRATGLSREESVIRYIIHSESALWARYTWGAVAVTHSRLCAVCLPNTNKQ